MKPIMTQLHYYPRIWHKAKESFHCEKIGDVTLKNKANPVVVYKVIA